MQATHEDIFITAAALHWIADSESIFSGPYNLADLRTKNSVDGITKSQN
jgi:hypothetical protein